MQLHGGNSGFTLKLTAGAGRSCRSSGCLGSAAAAPSLRFLNTNWPAACSQHAHSACSDIQIQRESERLRIRRCCIGIRSAAAPPVGARPAAPGAEGRGRSVAVLHSLGSFRCFNTMMEALVVKRVETPFLPRFKHLIAYSILALTRVEDAEGRTPPSLPSPPSAPPHLLHHRMKEEHSAALHTVSHKQQEDS